jgi:transposase-like protein
MSVAPSVTSTLSPVQARVVAALAQGASITEAARAGGIHRSTIYNWLQSEPEFRTAVQESRAEFAQYIRAELRELTTLAVSTLRQLLVNADTPPAIRLRAATAVLQAGVRYQVTEDSPAYMLESWRLNALARKAEAEAAHSESGAGVESAPADEPITPFHPSRHFYGPLARTGRNSPCPCGSGQKYKRCCGKDAPPLTNPAESWNSSPKTDTIRHFST